ncbi:FAD-binding oxidoreductase [Nakamurella endophytica]|uniref:Oxidoreductase n=1 Tax=Nakamurella endophytica TaxID=1748367 RepID=A0A917T1B4_9ACTN|nr:FAD-dependent oxidoreductase [Nakamurella endophytica]GGM06973.1 oxidoreductase [Nakamurella endophytica]
MTVALDLESLAATLAGTVVTPADPEWPSARMAWNLAVDQQPAFVVQVADADDVAAVVRYAGAAGLRVTPQGTGHNAAPLGDLSSTILLRTDRLQEVTVDPAARRVRIGAGVVWSQVTEALRPHGLTALAGSAPDVGVVGYTLGGGYSWLARKYGLAASRVQAVELVTGDGTFCRVDRDHRPELFRAVRGGGANLGVVCALEFDVLPLSQVYAGWLMFPLDRAREVLDGYRAWTDGLDEAATTCVRLLRIPPLPDLPDFLSGRSFAMVDGAVDLPEAEAAELLAPLRALGPVIDTFAPMSTADLGQLHMDPPGPAPACGDGFVLDDLPSAAVDVLMELAGPGVDTPLLLVDLRHLGGALARRDPDGGAVDHLPGRFLGFTGGMVPVPEALPVVRAAVHRLVDAVQPWRSGRDYLNFREAADDPARFFDPATLQLLRALRAELDPAGVLRSNHAF